MHFRQSFRDLAHLVRFETDPFTRWQALNDFAILELISAARAQKDGGQSGYEPLLVESLQTTLDDDTLEPALRAHALTLPGEADIAR